eukprot:scaffold666745_cov57-Prasinocladus_malaysianus.AAC.1
MRSQSPACFQSWAAPHLQCTGQRRTGTLNLSAGRRKTILNDDIIQYSQKCHDNKAQLEHQGSSISHSNSAIVNGKTGAFNRKDATHCRPGAQGT